MSDIKEALVHSEQNAIAALSETTAICQYPVMALPDGMEIHDLEEYQMQRNQFRGRLSTTSIGDFLAYANKQASGSCFLSRENMSAEAIFDIGTKDAPGHCKHIAFLGLMETSAYKTFTRIEGERITQQSLAEFLEDWSSDISVYEHYGDSAEMDVKVAAEAVRNVTIVEQSKADHGVQSFSVNKSAIEELNATSKDKPLPGIIEFTCVPYKGLTEYTFSLRISMIIRKNDSPQFSLRGIKIDSVLEEIQEEFIDMVTDGLSDTVTPYLGSFRS